MRVWLALAEPFAIAGAEAELIRVSIMPLCKFLSLARR
jgi:hypothetical protein